MPALSDKPRDVGLGPPASFQVTGNRATGTKSTRRNSVPRARGHRVEHEGGVVERSLLENRVNLMTPAYCRRHDLVEVLQRLQRGWFRGGEERGKMLMTSAVRGLAMELQGL